MKRSVLFFVAAMLSLASPAFAETTVGVVNIQQIMRDSKAANSVRNQLKEKQKSFQSDLDSKEKQLLAEDQALAKQSETADKKAFEQKVKDFRTKAANAQREVQTKKIQLDKAFAGALEQIQTTVLAIVKEVATEKKLTLVLTSSQVLYADSSLDITRDVQARLDSKLPNVKVNF